ncbi:ATP-binding protein [Mariniblastus fucicola]|uniref:histidine kinase n=1 Tax=Mariniblastus fucicola TaxID=980251 RepID=A0A5B9P9I8_9BACT|nr:ATP-binding protein [Mariniblastus fucicola]QEG21276.1 Sensor protein FixL [Mariniblastus fucicola]
MQTQSANRPTGQASSSRLEDVDIRIRNLLQRTEDLIYFKDLNSVITLCSDSMTVRFTGSSDESIVGKSDFDFFDRECAEKFFADEQEIIRTGKPIFGVVQTELRDGKTAWVSSSKLPLFDVEGKIIGTFGISRDITAQREMELELHKSNQKLVDASRRAGMAEIATNVLHNVGNVLTSVKISVSHSGDLCEGFAFDKIERVADLIEQHGTDEDFFAPESRGSHIPEFLRQLTKSFEAEQSKVRAELANCRRHLDHISTIVAQQQDYATASKVIERVDLSKLISDAITMSSSSLENHNIRVVRDFDEGLLVETDKHQILQIIVNLIRNAKHACLESESLPKQIMISASNIGQDRFSIRVSDNGIGIAKENILKLFTYGFTTRDKGKGFGLHSCANSARELGGSLAVKSEGLGKGATFVLTLPGKLK